MARHMPLGCIYRNREEAKNAVRLASVHAFGNGVCIDNSRSSGSNLCLICENATNVKKEEQSASAPAEESCQFTAFAHCKRATKRCHDGSGSGGQASHDNATSLWSFKCFDTGLNYVPHSDDCTAKIRPTKDVLQQILSVAVSANPNVSGKAMLSHLSARSAPLSVADAPSYSSMYRARMAIRSNSNIYYNEFWARIETYLNDFKQANPTCHVVLEKDADNRFKLLDFQPGNWGNLLN